MVHRSRLTNDGYRTEDVAARRGRHQYCSNCRGTIVGTAIIWDKVFNLDQSSLRIAVLVHATSRERNKAESENGGLNQRTGGRNQRMDPDSENENRIQRTKAGFRERRAESENSFRIEGRGGIRRTGRPNPRMDRAEPEESEIGLVGLVGLVRFSVLVGSSGGAGWSGRAGQVGSELVG